MSKSRRPSNRRVWIHCLLIGLMSGTLTACASDLQTTKVSGSLQGLTEKQTVAILPVEISDNNQAETARLFRQSLHANLRQSRFQILEPYVIDALLRKHGYTRPAQFKTINPMRFGEILGVDAVILSCIDKVKRSYLLVHSTIEVGVTVQMVDTRSGEILWQAEQSESDYQGIAKIPTGIVTAVLAPIYFVTNKLNLDRLTSTMVDKLTAIVKRPEAVDQEETFEEPQVVATASRDLERLDQAQKIRAAWEAAEARATGARETGPEAEPAVHVASLPRPQTDAVLAPPDFSEGKDRPKASRSWQTISIPPVRDSQTPLSVPGEPVQKSRREIAKPAFAPPSGPSPGSEDSKTWENQFDQQTPDTRPVLLSALHATHAGTKADSGILFTIQVGAYKTKRFAERMLTSLIRKGYNAFVSLFPTEDEEEPLYRVRVEKFEAREAALELARQLERRENLDSFVTTLDPG
ncbi:MAG: hypothetical protein GWO19_23295 [Nitrospinaceae bacterium]|nr:hypothetical protein [Nitrospinaceae bacterium]